MGNRPLNILQINTKDQGGGAAKVAFELHQTYQLRGINSWLAVREKTIADPQVIQIPNLEFKPHFARALLQLKASVQKSIIPGKYWLGEALKNLAEPRRNREVAQGLEDYNHPGIWHLLDVLPEQPDIIHCHNLHGNYFDLRALPWLSRKAPLILTLQDAWILSGHCSHSFDCDRWQTGCGKCPDLTIYPSIKRDATAENWQRKKEIFAQSQLFLVTPCQWLMDKVTKSMLVPGIKSAKVIPNGIDLSLYHPADKGKVRAKLGIPHDALVLLFAADKVQTNIFKDYQTVRKAATLLAKQLPKRKLIFLALSGPPSVELIGHAELHILPFQKHDEDVVRYYQAADVYVHGARADTFPNVILEALACGTPVVATAVGGIPEQIKGLESSDHKGARVNLYGREEASGILVKAGDAEEMAAEISQLLTDDALRKQLGTNATKDVRARFNKLTQADSYLQWYQEIIGCWEKATKEI